MWFSTCRVSIVLLIETVDTLLTWQMSHFHAARVGGCFSVSRVAGFIDSSSVAAMILFFSHFFDNMPNQTRACLGGSFMSTGTSLEVARDYHFTLMRRCDFFGYFAWIVARERRQASSANHSLSRLLYLNWFRKRFDCWLSLFPGAVQCRFPAVQNTGGVGRWCWWA